MSAPIALCLAFASACAAARPAPTVCGRPLEGTFVQLSARQFDYDIADWLAVLERGRALGMNSLVVQYTGDANGVFDSRLAAGTRGIESLLTAADGLQMEIWLGLFFDPDWPRGDTLARLPAPLGDLESASRLAAWCTSHRSCAGWYLPQEPNDVDVPDAVTEHGVRHWLHETLERLHALTPGRPVAISTFAAGRYDPLHFGLMWDRLLESNHLDVLIFQDGSGTPRGRRPPVSQFLNELRWTTDARGVRLWSVIELFEQTQGTPLDSRPFRAIPASIDRVRESMTAVRPFVERSVGFTLLDYMDPSNGAAAARLSRDYSTVCLGRRSIFARR